VDHDGGARAISGAASPAASTVRRVATIMSFLPSSLTGYNTGMTTTVEISAPRTTADLEAIKALFREYAESLGFSLAYQDFEKELADFPGKYAAPEGALLLAKADTEAAGTVALRKLEAG